MAESANLTNLTSQINAAFPGRARSAIENPGCDTSHAAAGSAHCSGRAKDYTVDARSGATGDAIAAIAIANPNVKNIIHNRRIWTRRTGTWAPFEGNYTRGARAGTPRDPHLHHVHVEVYPTNTAPAARADPNPSQSTATTPRRRRRRPQALRRTSSADPGPAPGGGARLVEGEPTVVLGTKQAMVAHVETPHTGGGQVAKGSATVFVGRQQLAFARKTDPTTDGQNVKTGDESILVG